MNDPRFSGADQNPVTGHFDLWTSALLVKSAAGRGSNGRLEAYGIKRLRELILELAVRGELVSQNPSDEPASELLKRIRTEKAKLIAAGAIKNDKIPPSIAEDETPFGLPIGWAYSNLGDVVEIVRGITFPGNEKSKTPENGRIACLRTSNVQDQIEWDDILYIKDKFVSREDQLLKPRDIVMSMANSRELVGKVALVGEEIKQKTTFGGFLGVLRPFLIDPRFVIALLRTPHSRSRLIDSASQTTNIANISLAKLRPLFFAIPPLAEQRRIVTKVDELMGLCDQLEQQQGRSIEAHQTLVETLLGALTSFDSANEFAAAWHRIAEHFDTLFATEHSIDQLKQTILQLAVMGKLVPQDSSDESAKTLLEKISKEKLRLAKIGQIKGAKKLPAVTTAEELIDLPDTWTWARWDDIALKIGDIDHKMPEEVQVGYPYVSPRDFSQGNQIDFDGAKKISEKDFLRLAEKIKPQLGDIIYPRYGTIGENRLVETDRDFLASYSCCIIKTMHGFIDPKYQFIFSISELAQRQAKDAENKTTQANVGIKSIQNYVVPVPPFAEQQRIVSKVDELMALCDALKARLAEAQTTQIRLADAIVERAVAAPELSAA